MSHLAKERRVQLAAPPAPKYSEVARSETRSEGEARLGIFLAFFLEEKTDNFDNFDRDFSSTWGHFTIQKGLMLWVSWY